jgi:hypothetical protein
MKFLKGFIYLLITISILFTAAGRYMNMLETGKITPEHLWNDGLFLLLIAIFLVHFA